GRQSRFSKIGGEMVPHIRIEELLLRLTEDEANQDEPGVRLAVTAVPDPRKGERLIVLHKAFGRPVDQVLRELSEAGLPNLWIPDAEAFVEVDEIPVLGTGKLDLRGMKELAAEKAGRV